MPATLMFDDRETDWSTFDDALLRAASGFERLGVAAPDTMERGRGMVFEMYVCVCMCLYVLRGCL